VAKVKTSHFVMAHTMGQKLNPYYLKQSVMARPGYVIVNSQKPNPSVTIPIWN
jgi:hypothetical protein